MSDKTLKRRDFIVGAALFSAASASSFPSPAIAYGKRRWNMVTAWPKFTPGLSDSANRLAKRIEELSESKIEIKIYNDGELINSSGIFDSVSEGDVHMGHSAPYYWTNKNKAAAFFCSVPAGLTAQEYNGWINFGGGKQLWDELYSRFGLISFSAGNTGCQMGGWFNKEINEIKDFDNLKMRIVGLGADVISRLGATPKNIEPKELFTSMQSNSIDALQWISAWNDMSFGFHRVAKYYYYPSFSEAGVSVELMINKKYYDGLPKNLQQVIETSCAAENSIMLAEYNANNARSFQSLKYKHNIDIRKYPVEVIKSLSEISDDVVSNIANEGDIERRIYESYAKYRQYSMHMRPFSQDEFITAEP